MSAWGAAAAAGAGVFVTFGPVAVALLCRESKVLSAAIASGAARRKELGYATPSKPLSKSENNRKPLLYNGRADTLEKTPHLCQGGPAIAPSSAAGSAPSRVIHVPPPGAA